MPIFSAQKKAGSERGTKNLPGTGPGGGGGGVEKKAATPPLPPPPGTHHRPGPAGRTTVPSRQELVFHCQLAHGSPTKEIRDFSNVKELYARIAEAFEIPADQVIVCVAVGMSAQAVPRYPFSEGEVLHEFAYSDFWACGSGCHRPLTFNC